MNDTLETERPMGSRELLVSDRCDRCPAQAFVIAVMPSGNDLLFCGHHYAKHETALAARGARIDDHRHMINSVSASSA